MVWACARSGLHDHRLLASVPTRFKSQAAVSLLPDWGLCALAWSYQVVDPNRSFDNFQDALKAETDQRSFSASKVEGSKVGPHSGAGQQVEVQPAARGHLTSWSAARCCLSSIVYQLYHHFGFRRCYHSEYRQLLLRGQNHCLAADNFDSISC